MLEAMWYLGIFEVEVGDGGSWRCHMLHAWPKLRMEWLGLGSLLIDFESRRPRRAWGLYSSTLDPPTSTCSNTEPFTQLSGDRSGCHTTTIPYHQHQRCLALSTCLVRTCRMPTLRRIDQRSDKSEEDNTRR